MGILIKSEHAHLLNALDEMQQSVAYAARRTTLHDAEVCIVQQEQQIADMQKDHQAALDEVMKEAVWAMEQIVDRGVIHPDSAQDIWRSQAFLARPDVLAWRARQKEQGK